MLAKTIMWVYIQQILKLENALYTEKDYFLVTRRHQQVLKANDGRILKHQRRKIISSTERRHQQVLKADDVRILKDRQWKIILSADDGTNNF